MQRLARSKRCSRTGSLAARKRRSRLPRTRYLANPASLIGIPRLEAAHAGSRITFGCSDLTALARNAGRNRSRHGIRLDRGRKDSCRTG